MLRDKLDDIIMALESANIPIPSEVTMPLSGWLLTPKAQFPALQTFLIAGGWGGWAACWAPRLPTL